MFSSEAGDSTTTTKLGVFELARINPHVPSSTLYLEGLDGAAIGDIAGISSGAVATKIHRIKYKLSDLFKKGDAHVGT